MQTKKEAVMCEGVFGGMVHIDELFPQPDSSSSSDKGNGRIFNSSYLSAKEQKEFQEMLSGEPFEFCSKKWAKWE